MTVSGPRNPSGAVNDHLNPRGRIAGSGIVSKSPTLSTIVARAALTDINAQTTTFTRNTSAVDPLTGAIKYANQRRTRTITVAGTNYSADLIEINRVNLVAAGTSEHFERMTAGSGSPTITADTTTAPNGETVADSLIEGSGTGLHSVSQNITKAASALDYSAGVLVKIAAGTRSFRLQVDDGTTSNGVYVTINPSTGALVTAPTAFGTGWAVQTAQGTSGYTITSYGSGWYRVTLTATSDTTTTIRVLCALESGGSISYAGDSTSAVYLWALTLEQAGFPTSPILNRNMALGSEFLGGSAWTRTRSAVTTDAVADPITGNTTADKLTEDATAGNTHFLSLSSTPAKAASSLTYTLSVYAKAAERTWILIGCGLNATPSNGAGAYFDLGNGATGGTFTAGAGWALTTKAITAVSGGWYRCVVTITTDSGATIAPFIRLATADGTSSYNGDGASGVYLWGSQLEYGSTATQYWSTNTSSGQRAADALSVTFAPSTTQGSIYGVIIPNLWAVSPSLGGQTGTTSALSGVTTTNYLQVNLPTGGTISFGRGDAGGAQQATINSTLANRTLSTIAGTWDATSVNVWQNGVLGTPDTVLTAPYGTETSVTIGNLTGSSRYIDGWVWFGYSTSVLSDSQIKVLHANTTAP